MRRTRIVSKDGAERPQVTRWPTLMGSVTFNRPLTVADAEALATISDLAEIVLTENATIDAWRALNKVLTRRPEIGLWVLRTGLTDRGFETADFLAFLPSLRHLVVEDSSMHDVRGFYEHPGLNSLTIACRLKGSTSLEFLGRHRTLTRLSVIGHSNGLDAVSTLTQLRSVSLDVAVKSLGFVAGLPRLREVFLFHRAVEDISALADVPRLRSLMCQSVRGLSNIDVLADLRMLEVLRLENLRRVIEMPSLSALVRLKDLVLIQMGGLKTLPALPKNLTRVFIAAHRIPAAQFRPLLSVPSLRRVFVAPDSRALEAVRTKLATVKWGYWPPPMME